MLAALTANTRRRRLAWRVIGIGLHLADADFARTFRAALSTGLQRMARVEAHDTMRRQNLAGVRCGTTEGNAP